MNNPTNLHAALETAWEKKQRLDLLMNSAQNAQAELTARKFFTQDFGVEPDNVCGYRCRQGEIEVELVLDPQYNAWRAWALIGICPQCHEETISNEHHPNDIHRLYPLLTNFVPNSAWHTCSQSPSQSNPLERIANALERLISAEEASIAMHSPTLLDTLEGLINSPMPPMDTLTNLSNET